MNDRYLFKAKTVDWKDFPKEERWVYGYYVRGFNVYEEPIHVILDPTTIFDKNKTDGWDEVDPTTLCQCTGLKDKAGKLIWENDVCDRKERVPEIVNYNNGDWQLDYSYAYGKERGYACCNLGFYVKERKCIEVIGNIFDNPELLEVSENECT